MSFEALDLNLDNYSLEDLYKLFNVENGILDENELKYAKRMVLKMHPDKSKIDSKYFLFFSKAYKRLYSIYEFQNKCSTKKPDNDKYTLDENHKILDNLFKTFDQDQKHDGKQNGKKKNNLKEPKNFNTWFNGEFEKYKVESSDQQGYGDWLKSNEGIIQVEENITKENMNHAFEKYKKQIQSVTVYKGVSDLMGYNSLGGTLFDDSGNNFSGDNYTDLRQAFTETLIPITQDDYNNIPKYGSLNEYKTHRDGVNIVPLSFEESERQLMRQKQGQEQESSAIAFKFIQESEKVKKQQQSFWADLKRLT